MTPALLTRTAARCSSQPGFLGHLLARYGAPEDVAARLSCSVEAVHQLCLCTLPREEHWSSDVRMVAVRFGIDPEALLFLLAREPGE
jgi:hypothetical protein